MAALVEAGRQNGYGFAADDVRAALRTELDSATGELDDRQLARAGGRVVLVLEELEVGGCGDGDEDSPSMPSMDRFARRNESICNFQVAVFRAPRLFCSFVRPVVVSGFSRTSFFGRSRSMNWLDGFSLDLKLGGRMLVKYPGLTIVGGLAMAFAICVGTVIFEVLTLFVHPTLPLPAGERIVQIRNWDVAANSAEPRALHDFVVWRGALRSVTELGAWRDVTRNLIVAGGDARPVEVAEITASGFRDRRGCAAPGPRPRCSRRAGRCATGGRARVRRVANALRERPRCARPHRAARKRVTRRSSA